ncbi:MAG: amidohydrolase family protein, partial [Thermoanaerobaculia bacterium]|nr:amidohydrolase family protein [Thermoanaerobaculia bacterium]
KQLGIADRVGSLEAGKDADFVLWSDHPLSSAAVCLETWIDGRKYFDRARDLAMRDELAAERAALIAKARADSEKTPEAESDKPKPEGADAEAPEMEAGR